jgi:hypothetical protein
VDDKVLSNATTLLSLLLEQTLAQGRLFLVMFL